MFAVVHWLIGAAGTTVLACINIEEALDHFVAVESGEEKDGGFARADDEFSGAVGHWSRFSCT